MNEQQKTGATAPPVVHNGTYTISHDTRGHFTLKLYTVAKGDMAGKRIIALLNGPDNVNNYRGVAFWSEDPEPIAHCWKRFRGLQNVRIDGSHWTHDMPTENGVGLSAIQKKLCIWADMAIRGDGTGPDGRSGYWSGEGYRLDLAGVCVVCNRKLTDPESIRLGIGPVCGDRS